MAQQQVDYRKLSGADKVAILLMSVSEENATKILSLMEQDEIKEISYTMSNLARYR